LVDVESETGARVQVFASTDTLLPHVDNLDHFMSKKQLVIDSKRRGLLNNYPITAVGILDAGQQYTMIALAVSNKEDEEVFILFVQAVKDSSQLLELYPKFTCTMSDNSGAIQRALRRCFPSAVLGNFLFHLQQTIKKKRTLWNVQVLLTVPVNARSKWTIRRRDENESFASNAINWFPSLQHVYEFKFRLIS
jgi:MULE transposase domain